MLFEEFVNSGKAFFFAIEHGQTFLKICLQYAAEKKQLGEEQAFEKIVKELTEHFKFLQQFYFEYTQQVQFSPMSRFFMPINDDEIFLIEVNPQIQSIVLYQTAESEDEDKYQCLIDLVEEVEFKIRSSTSSSLILSKFSSTHRLIPLTCKIIT